MKKKLWQTNCGNSIAKIGKKNCDTYCGNAIAEIGKINLWQTNCGNGIAEIGKKNCDKLIVAMVLLKKKKKSGFEIWGRVKKESVTSIIFLQHFHNKSHVISYY